ncbi:MAG: sigma regulator [Pseudomonadota bacterium]|jgi:regulator of sigma D
MVQAQPAACADLDLLISRWRLQRIEVRRLLLLLLSGEVLTFPASEQAQNLHALCSELVDYISTGHFEVYGRVLARELRPDAELHALLQHIFYSIGKSTDAVLAFNDRYQQGRPAALTNAFRRMLVRLSRALLLRFALEEQLLDLGGYTRRR